jgi:predicted AlkP superfamily pyrophosphatase or phosphodiesterase
MFDRVVLLSIPQLRRRDVTPGALPALESLACRGGVVELEPAFPGLTASAFATMVTGTGPYRHGVVGNTYFDRRTRQVVRPPLPDSANLAPKLWERLREARPEAKTLLWFAPNGQGAGVEVAAGLDEREALVTTPADLAGRLEGRFGAWPLARRAADEPPRLAGSAWILRTAAATIAEVRPELAIVRVPHLGQVARRFGPDGREANRAIRELQPILAEFLDALPPRTVVVAATESVTTPVSGAVEPNLVLRGLGLLALADAPGGGLDIDTERSAAFALADHQICHIYVNDPSQTAAIASAFSGEHSEGIAVVAPGGRRAQLGLDHPRAGDVVLVARPDRWFCGDWWHEPPERPDVARCASGLSPGRPGVPIDVDHVAGSHGAPTADPSYLGVVLASHPDLLVGLERLAARDLADLLLAAVSPVGPGIEDSRLGPARGTGQGRP